MNTEDPNGHNKSTVLQLPGILTGDLVPVDKPEPVYQSLSVFDYLFTNKMKQLIWLTINPNVDLFAPYRASVTVITR